MRKLILAAALPSLLLFPAAAVEACPYGSQASRAAIVVADNAPTSSQAPDAGAPGVGTKTPDTVAFPNSPNGSPASGNKGAPVVTDKAACGGAGKAKCPDSPEPSKAADTGDTKISTPTTVNGKAATP